ncbi:hypothetical protein F5Y01DRAFT_269943 [Xylaria sp. FL0043]|nr:hypothetical protein F5Y01DRAFT_269943 [Xylaria sp. FL0043]
MASVYQIVKRKRAMMTLPPFHHVCNSNFTMHKLILSGSWRGTIPLNPIPFGNIFISPAASGIVTTRGLLEALEYMKLSRGATKSYDQFSNLRLFTKESRT